MRLTHKFRSGNDCEIYIRQDFPPGLIDNTVAWEYFPPSAEDLREYREEVLPGKVIPAMVAVLERVKSAGRFVEVKPGIWAWIEAGSRS